MVWPACSAQRNPHGKLVQTWQAKLKDSSRQPRETSRMLQIMKWILGIAFVLILASLGSAMVFLIRDAGKTSNVVRALSVRIGLSVALFLFLLLANQLGWIQSTGIPVQ